MELVSLILLAAAIGVVAWAIGAAARVARASAAVDTTLEEDVDAFRLGELAERREMVMQLILSTELDHQTGKISDEDRDRTLARYKREAVVLMKEIDALGGEPEDLAAADQALEARLAEARAVAGDRLWSTAAKLRHGGQHPGEAT